MKNYVQPDVDVLVLNVADIVTDEDELSTEMPV